MRSEAYEKIFTISIHDGYRNKRKQKLYGITLAITDTFKTW